MNNNSNDTLKTKISKLSSEVKYQILFRLPQEKLIQLCSIDDKILSICWSSYFVECMNWDWDQNILFKLKLCDAMIKNKKFTEYISYIHQLDEMFDIKFTSNINQIRSIINDNSKSLLVYKILDFKNIESSINPICGKYFKFFINVEQIYLSDRVQNPIHFPDNVKYICIDKYKHPLDNFPASVEQITFKYSSTFNQKISWPINLKKILFANCSSYDRSLINLPKTLEEIDYTNNTELIKKTICTLPLHVKIIGMDDVHYFPQIDKIPKHLIVVYDTTLNDIECGDFAPVCSLESMLDLPLAMGDFNRSIRDPNMKFNWV